MDVLGIFIRCFFVTVASAALGLLLLLLLVLFIFIEAIANPALLRTSPHFDSKSQSLLV